MAETQESAADNDLEEIRRKIRESIKDLQQQYGKVEQAVDSCVTLKKNKDIKQCKMAATRAQKEIIVLLHQSEILFNEARDLYNSVSGIGYS